MHIYLDLGNQSDIYAANPLMLRNTFLHIPGIGRITERRLWKSGLTAWDLTQNPKLISGVSRRLNSVLGEYIPQSVDALSRRDFSFFDRLLRHGEAWRFYPELVDRCVFLDIETTGLSPYFDQITMVGLYDGKDYKVFVRGKNLEKFLSEMKKYSLIVTFNGSLFDLRFIRLSFPQVSLPPVHVDLRFATRRLGLQGGLKEVENKLGIRRPKSLERLTGYDATVLWSRYVRGDRGALETLVGYNMQDVVNLKAIAEIAYERLRRKLFPHRTKRRSDVPRKAFEIVPSKWAKPFLVYKSKQGGSPIVTELLSSANGNGTLPRVVGIDLTGSAKRATGWAVLDGDIARTKRVSTDEEIIRETVSAKPDLVSIDSPLSLPSGYPNHRMIYRQCELTLKRMGISVFWCLLPSMRTLTIRGIRLAREFRAQGLHVIESYPGAAQDVLLIPRKKASTEELKWGLIQAGFKGDWVNEKISHDELDAITSALVGLFYLAKQYWALGNQAEDYLIIPRTPQLSGDKILNIAGTNVLIANGAHVSDSVSLPFL